MNSNFIIHKNIQAYIFAAFLKKKNLERRNELDLIQVGHKANSTPSIQVYFLKKQFQLYQRYQRCTIDFINHKFFKIYKYNQNQIQPQMESFHWSIPSFSSKDKISQRKNFQSGSSASLVQEINQMINDYEKLKKEDQEKCRKMLMKHIQEELAKFQAKIDASKVDLKNLNLIVGTTGAGKSALFNYLNDVPLIVSTKKAKNKEGKEIERLQPILLVDEQRVKKTNVIYAPIGCGVQSETTIPNFCLSKAENVAYVDCAGQFDSKDVIQSIVNSYFKYELAQKAEKVKLTIAFNYQALNIDRGTSFKKLMNQVGKFIGLWDQFVKSQSVSLVITNAPRQQNLAQIIYSMLQEIIQESEDLKQLKPLIQSIIQRKSVAFFYLPQPQLISENGKKPKLGYKHGTVYERKQVVEINVKDVIISSPQMIIKTLSKTKFMNKKQGLFKQNLQQKAQKKVDIICQDMLQKIKDSIVKAALVVVNDNLKKQQNKTEYTTKLKYQLTKCKDIKEMVNVLAIPDGLLTQYKQYLQGFALFEKISNIANVEQKMRIALESLTAMVSEQLNNLLLKDLTRLNQKLIGDVQIENQRQRRLEQIKKLSEKLDQIKLKIQKYDTRKDEQSQKKLKKLVSKWRQKKQDLEDLLPTKINLKSREMQKKVKQLKKQSELGASTYLNTLAKWEYQLYDDKFIELQEDFQDLRDDLKRWKKQSRNNERLKEILNLERNSYFLYQISKTSKKQYSSDLECDLCDRQIKDLNKKLGSHRWLSVYFEQERKSKLSICQECCKNISINLNQFTV